MKTIENFVDKVLLKFVITSFVLWLILFSFFSYHSVVGELEGMWNLLKEMIGK